MTSASFTIEIEEAIRDENAILSANEFTELENRVAEHIKNLNDTEVAVKEAEAERAETENARVEAETARDAAETERVEAEEAREASEAGRVAAEETRNNAESVRDNAEAEREDAEKKRVEAEKKRVTAENGRTTAENQREDAEDLRVQNEETRITQEQAREENAAKAIERLTSHLVDESNPHKTTASQVGLGRVDNTPDAEKPVSVAQQDALDLAYQQSTGYTDLKISELINGAPNTLDTLGEIAAAMRENENVVDALEEAIGKKANAAEFDTHNHDERYYTETEIQNLLAEKLDAETAVATVQSYVAEHKEELSGPQGPKGDNGAVGPQGPKGDTGAIGPQGPKGDTGARGATGATGSQGPKGDTGATGAQGPRGYTGATGPQGPQGPSGSPWGGGTFTGGCNWSGYGNVSWFDGDAFHVGSTQNSIRLLLRTGNNRTCDVNNLSGGWPTLCAGSFNTVSSERYKENIVDMYEEEADKILKVRVTKFDYKDDVIGTSQKDGVHGAIAEEVAKIIPEVVGYRDIEDLGYVPDNIDYSKFAPYLIKKMQMQQKEINELKADNLRLEKQIVAIEERLGIDVSDEGR